MSVSNFGAVGLEVLNQYLNVLEEVMGEVKGHRMQIQRLAQDSAYVWRSFPRNQASKNKWKVIRK